MIIYEKLGGKRAKEKLNAKLSEWKKKNCVSTSVLL